MFDFFHFTFIAIFHLTFYCCVSTSELVTGVLVEDICTVTSHFVFTFSPSRLWWLLKLEVP